MNRLPFLTLLLTFSLVCGNEAGELVFEETLIEVLATSDQEQVTADFAFKSEGEGAAVIKRYDAPCSCLEAQISEGGRLSWAAGTEGSVRGIFKIGNFLGTVDKQISILMADGKRHDLTVRMTTPELLKIEPKTLKWDEGGPLEQKSFQLTISEDEPLKILKVTGTNEEKFPFELETIEEGKRYRLSVTPAETQSRGFGLIRITTNSQFKKHQSYQAFVVVKASSAEATIKQ